MMAPHVGWPAHSLDLQITKWLFGSCAVRPSLLLILVLQLVLIFLRDEDAASSSASDPEDGEDNLTKARFCDRAESTELSFKLFGFDTSSLP